MKTVGVDQTELNVGEMEGTIAPAPTRNHNQAFVAELEVEQVEEVIAPSLTMNCNETFTADP